MKSIGNTFLLNSAHVICIISNIRRFEIITKQINVITGEKSYQ